MKYTGRGTNTFKSKFINDRTHIVEIHIKDSKDSYVGHSGYMRLDKEEVGILISKLQKQHRKMTGY